LFRIPVYSGFQFIQGSDYSGFSLDKFHCT
jgi:hypothetical protein